MEDQTCQVVHFEITMNNASDPSFTLIIRNLPRSILEPWFQLFRTPDLAGLVTLFRFCFRLRFGYAEEGGDLTWEVWLFSWVRRKACWDVEE